MSLETLRLAQFRNYEAYSVSFRPGLNIITGRNGIGKTALLEAVHYLSLSKSFRTNRDTEAVNFDSDHFLVEGRFADTSAGPDRVQVAYSRSQGKRIRLGRRIVKRASELVGKFPVIVLAPLDTRLTMGPPAEQRRFLNQAISQCSPVHLDDLLAYRQVLRQRKAILTKLRAADDGVANGRPALQALVVWDAQLAAIGARIISSRAEFTGRFAELFRETAARLDGDGDRFRVAYRPSVSPSADTRKALLAALKQRRDADRAVGETTVGPHRDRFVFSLGGRSLRKYGSQGEHKIALIALKIAEGLYLNERTGRNPIYLLDDIFAELDPEKAALALRLVEGQGQVLMTATHLTMDGRLPAARRIDLGEKA